MKKDFVQLTGANRKGDRSESDFYPTPPAGTIALINFLETESIINRSMTIWEPACGNGIMADQFAFRNYKVICSDITTGQDFLNWNPEQKFDAIITNPPFKLASEFINRALSLSPIVAMLLKSQAWHSKNKFDIFQKNEPSFVCPLTWRLDFLNGAKSGRPTMEVAWTIWTRADHRCIYQPLPKP